MRFGVHLPNFGAFGDARLLAELAQEAETAGWGGFFIWDHIARVWPVPVVDPWVALAAIAINTRRLHLGALVTALPRRRPWKVARETVSIHRLSRSRLIFSAGIGGAGGRDVEWANLGEVVDLRKRGAMLDEGLQVMAGLWSGEPFSYQGKYYQVENSRFLPAARHMRRIPIWIGGYWPNKQPFQRAAKWDGVVPYLFEDRGDRLKQFREVVQYVDEVRKGGGPFDKVMIANAQPGTVRSLRHETAMSFAEVGASRWIEEITPQHFGANWQDKWPLQAMKEYIQEGPPKNV